MQVIERDAGSGAEQVAHVQPAVERWLGWTGLVPLPAFLALHLGRELALAFAGDVSDVVRPPPTLAVQLTAWLLVWMPLVAHAGLGAWLLLGPGARPARVSDVPRPARVVSRATAVLALLFVGYHGRAYGLAHWLGESDARDAGFRLLAELSAVHFGAPLSAAAYVLGVLATITHGSLGIHRVLLRQGFLQSARQRRASARACAAFGVVLFMMGAAAVVRVATGVLLR
jgi:succinate dehydrogenase / fumarate reductase cytochrome b subunit